MKPPFPYFGGKMTIAPRIVDLLPPHQHYIEPFAGSMSVLLAKPPAKFETVNDLDGRLVTFWRVLREQPEELIRRCALTPHSRAEYHRCREEPTGKTDVETARRVWVVLSQGRAGTLGGRRTGWKYYVDPPYLGTARSSNNREYENEMREPAEHRALAAALHNAAAAVVLSGYHSPLYDELYADWDRVTLPSATGNGKVGAQQRTEVLWSNRPLHLEARLFDMPIGGGP